MKDMQISEISAVQMGVIGGAPGDKTMPLEVGATGRGDNYSYTGTFSGSDFDNSIADTAMSKDYVVTPGELEPNNSPLPEDKTPPANLSDIYGA